MQINDLNCHTKSTSYFFLIYIYGLSTIKPIRGPWTHFIIHKIKKKKQPERKIKNKRKIGFFHWKIGPPPPYKVAKKKLNTA